MDNPLKIIPVIWRARRPSRIDSMPVMVSKFWMPRNYAGMTFFGTILTGSKHHVKAFEQKGHTMRNHEMIHLRQAQSTHNSWLLFYLLYGWYSLLALPQNRKMKNAAYWLNPFEMEAYRHESDLHYLEHNEATEWRKYARMSPEERRKKFATS